jgi:O-antigen/teichoic acid export membrane protein
LGNIVGNLLLASNYRTGILLFQGMAVGYALSIIAGIMGERLLAYKRTGFLMITQAVMAVAYLGLFWVLVHRSGLHGAVMAFALYSLGSTVALGLVGWRLAVRSHSYSQSQSQSEPEEEEGVR